MSEPNRKLRSYRESMPSQLAPGEHMGRAELAEAVNQYLWEATGRRYELDAHAVARYERGQVRWPSAHYRSGLRSVLGASSDAELGFSPTPRGRNTTEATAPELSSVDHPSIQRPETILNSCLAETLVETPLPTRIGWTEVEHIRATTRAVAMSENLFGGGLSCEAAAAQLRWANRLLEVTATNEVRAATAEAVGNLSGVVAFSAFDIANYQASDNFFKFALLCADKGKSWPLRANTLAEMARKEMYLGKFDEALSLIEFAQVRSDRLTSTARAMLWTVRAQVLARIGRDAEAQENITKADESFSENDPSADPPWLCYYDSAEHQGSTGKALIPVAKKHRKPDEIHIRLKNSIRLYGDNYPRSRTFSRIRLATLLMNSGDPHEAVSVGRKAIEEASLLRSSRLSKELLGLAQISTRHAGIPDIADLRHDITALMKSTI